MFLQRLGMGTIMLVERQSGLINLADAYVGVSPRMSGVLVGIHP